MTGNIKQCGCSKINCDCNILKRCRKRDCKEYEPLWLLNCHNGMCMNCAAEVFSDKKLWYKSKNHNYILD